MFKRIHNKKGFLFPFAYFVLVAMTIYVATFANRALDNSNITKRNISSIQSRYLAQMGIECAISELKAKGSDWYTHVAVKNGSIYNLVPVSDEQKPDVSLDFCEIKTSGPDAGCYAAKNGDFLVKAYESPLSGATLFYSRGNAGDSSSTYVVKIQYKSLYEYFLFSPYELDLSHITLDASQGIMHSNKDIVLGDTANLLNVAQLSTPESIKYFAEAYVPEGYEGYYYQLRDPWVEPNKDGGYRNSDDGHLSGEKRGLLMEDPKNPGKYIEYDPRCYTGVCNPALDPDDYPEIYQDANLISFINGNQLPNRLDTEYLWNKYWRATEDYDYKPEEIPVKYTNSELQPKDWNSLMQSLDLEEIVKEANSGGVEIDELTISASDYENEAKSNGMHIGKAAVGPNYIVKVGGRNYPTDANGKIEIDGEVVIEIKSFFNTNSTNQNKTLVVYVDKLVEKEIYPANGIIYSEENIILDNAQTLPSPGLTTISERNIYIKGDYNTETWQPSSAIAAGLNYLLSDQFNYPQTLPDTFQNLESPYAEDFVEGRQNWYADHYQTMANAVDKDYRYVVSLVGYYGYMPETLERWWEYKSPGDLMTAPSDVVEHKREVIGALTRLPKDNFPINSLLLDLNKKGTRARTADGWPTNMGSVVPEDAQNFFSYDSHYLDPSNLKPPGDFMADNVKINLQIKSDRWSVSIPELY